MSTDLGEKLDEYIKNMPSLPTTVAKVLEVCNNPQTSPADLNHVISLDPVLVGRVLKLINSAYYGMGQQVTSLVRAIIMLGINTVKNLALSTAVMRGLSVKQEFQGLDMDGFWRHSLCVGVSAKLLARKRGINPKLTEEYFAAGLLHDIGKIPLNAILSKEYMLTVSAADREKIPLYGAEENILGMNHCASGASIVAAWKLGGPVGDAIIHHHHYTEYSGGFKDILYSVVVSNWFAAAMDMGFSGDRWPDRPDPSVWAALNVSREIFDGMEPVVNSEIEKAKIFLRL
ncbi:MAG: HDOD domain-containing protein [Treponema sp.]|jgi:HD-like signal output (HDOD) protein|nr:HDOD domain-containing protein [Treponema sp.]